MVNIQVMVWQTPIAHKRAITIKTITDKKRVKAYQTTTNLKRVICNEITTAEKQVKFNKTTIAAKRVIRGKYSGVPNELHCQGTHTEKRVNMLKTSTFLKRSHRR